VQVYIPNYNKPNPAAIATKVNGADGQVSGRACESCYSQCHISNLVILFLLYFLSYIRVTLHATDLLKIFFFCYQIFIRKEHNTCMLQTIHVGTKANGFSCKFSAKNAKDISSCPTAVVKKFIRRITLLSTDSLVKCLYRRVPISGSVSKWYRYCRISMLALVVDTDCSH
jgi:hypothetical protein